MKKGFAVYRESLRMVDRFSGSLRAHTAHGHHLLLGCDMEKRACHKMMSKDMGEF
jgi:hypothetical protein